LTVEITLESAGLPRTCEVYSRGPWWRRLICPQLVLIERGPVYVGDSIVIYDMQSLTRLEIHSSEWRNFESKEKLKLIGKIGRPKEGA